MENQRKKRDKPLRLKPSARDKRRYMLMKDTTHEKVTAAILEYIGVLGLAKAAYKPVKTPSKRAIIGSCLRSELVDVKAALTMAGISVEKVATTIKGLSKE